MFDFRYHALSLVAVFLALGIGIVLGASLGDSVVSEANRDVRSSLQGDVVRARDESRTAKAQVTNRDRFISASFDRLAGGRLRGQRVAIVSSGELPQDVESSARDAVKDAGGEVDSVARFDAEPDVMALGDALGGRYRRLDAADGPRRRLVRRLARALVRGAPAIEKLEREFPDAFSGDLRGADAVVYHRSESDRDAAAERFESALLDGLRDTGVPVVGVELSEADPSQVDFYEKAGLSTVDDVDQPAGKIAVVLTLRGAEGNFGFKSTADAPIPPEPPRRRRR